MADTIERTIYKLELDDSGYIRGVESMAASTKKFADQQEAANKRLLENEKSLKTSADVVEKNRKALESYTGSDKKYKEQLETTFKASQTGHEKLTELVDNVRKGYERAKKAAEDFANTSQRATGLQQGTTGGKIPTAPPPGIPSPIVTPPVVIPPTAPIIPPTAFADFGLAEILAESTVEFEKLRSAIGAAEVRMNALNAEDEEFKLLAPIVEKGKIALQQYDEAAKKASGSTLSLRGQLRQGRDDLVKLEQAGKGASKEYFELEKRVAKLTDEFGDQQARIKILASDTKLLDFGKGAITAATSAFQTYASISILAGNESAELQKKTMQLFAAMQLLQSLEQLSNLTRREGVLAVHLQSAAQATYTAVVGASTGALKAFRIALLATGIGAAVVAIGFLVKKYMDYRDAAQKAGAQQKILKEITEEAIKGYTAEATRLDLIKTKLNDLSIPQSKRLALAKDYNKTAEEGNKIDLKQIDNIALVNKAIDSQIAKIKERGLARAAENIITQRAEELQLAEEEARAKNIQFSIDATKQLPDISETQFQNIGGKLIPFKISDAQRIAQETAAQNKFVADRVEKDPEVIKAKQALNDALTVGGKFITTDTLTGPDVKTEAGKNVIQNEFARKKAELDARLAELTRKESDNESKIKIEFATRLAKEQLEIKKLLDDKKITKPQAEELKALNVQINTVELDKALADFRKKVADAREKINDELTDLQNKALNDSLNLIQDEFDRRAALIDFNEKKELANAKEATEDRLEALEFQRLLIGEQAYQDAKFEIITNGEQQALNTIQKFALDRQDLAADMFNTYLTFIDDTILENNLAIDEATVKSLRASAEKLKAGKITYEQFQKDVAKIQREAESKKQIDTLFLHKAELEDLQKHLDNIKDKTSKEYKDLLETVKKLRAQIAAEETEIITTPPPDPDKDPKTKYEEYAVAVGQLADSIISFWQKANEAESAALDRSISLQEKRVEAAQRIAERGNAQYLKQEEDRLKELQVARENAARRDLAINAALQASQLLVGITGAIAKLASGPLGAAAVIGEIAIIFAALAAGYGLVKSLQGNQPKLAEGTTYVTRGKNKSGKDTIPAWLNEGEAVIPTERNKAYHPTVKAIHEGAVPAEQLNNFVKNYKIYQTHNTVKQAPQPNYERIKDAAELKITGDGKMAVLLSEQNKMLAENNDLQRATIRALKGREVNVSLDKNGFAASYLEVVEQIKRDKRI